MKKLSFLQLCRFLLQGLLLSLGGWALLSTVACGSVHGQRAKKSEVIALDESVATPAVGKPPSYSKKNQQAAENQAMEKALLETARSIEKSLGTLAAAQDYKSPPLVNTTPLVTAEAGLGHTADVDWTGPVAQLLERIADVSHYRFKVLGKEPVIPVLVSINAQRAALADIIQNAGLQVGRRAQIMVFAKERVIELRYLNPT